MHDHTADLTAVNDQLRREIAQREQAEAEVRRLNLALEHRVAELQALFDALPVGVGISRDAECREIRTNRAFAAILGIAPEANASLTAPQGEAPTFKIFREGKQLGRDALPMQRAVRENQAILDFEETIQRADGQRVDVVVNALPIRDEQGRAAGVVATFQDITARKAAEQELRLVIEAAPDAILKIDAGGRIRLANSQAVALFGYAREALLGQSIELLMPERFRAEHLPQVADFLATPSPRSIGVERELFARRRDGSEVPVEVRLNPIRTPDGDMVLAAIIDVTGRRRAEQERLEFERRLAETQKLESVGVLAGGIAHDFNNLLTGILGNAMLVREQLGTEHPQMRRQLGEVEAAAQRAAGLCKQILAYAGQTQFVVQPLDLNRLIAAQEPLLKVSIGKMAVLELELDAPLRLIRGDDTQLRQVLMNLIINASEAIGDRPGKVAVRTRLLRLREEDLKQLTAGNGITPGWFVSLEVSDDGCGMTPEVMARIFEPFYTTKFIGRGLGLSALLGIMRGHKGGIRVTSTPQHGTRFQLLFPALEDSTAPFPPDSRAPMPTGMRGRGTVLVVDDEEYVRDFARDALVGAGFDVVMAADGEEAVALVKATPARFAAVVLDLRMPRMDGENALLAIRLLTPRLPVVLASGFDETFIHKRFLDRGLAGFIAKPFAPKALVDQVDDAIRKARRVV